MALSRLSTIFALWNRPSVLIGSLLFVSVAFTGMLYRSVHTFDAVDPKPVLHAYTDEQLSKAVPVKVGLVVAHVPEFKLTDNEFTFDLVMWFEFDESKISLEQVSKFSFQRGTITSLSAPVISKKGDTSLVWYRFRLDFSTPLDHRRFPLNDHTLYLVLSNESVEADAMRFVASSESLIIEPDVEMGVWGTVGQEVNVGYFSNTLRREPLTVLHNPGIVFSIDLAKKGMQGVFLIVLPMFILFVLALLTFILHPSNGAILFLATGSLTGLTAYRFVIQSVVPTVGYFTFTDHIFNLFLIAILLITMIDIFVVNTGEDTLAMRALKGATALGTLTVLLLSFYVLML